MSPFISILISVKDQLVLTQKCIDCLKYTLADGFHYEVLIANDGSTDGSKAYLDSLPAKFRSFHREKCHGFAKNNNY